MFESTINCKCKIGNKNGLKSMLIAHPMVVYYENIVLELKNPIDLAIIYKKMKYEMKYILNYVYE